MADILKFFKDLKDKADKTVDDASQNTLDLMVKTGANDPNDTEEEKYARAKSIKDLATSAGTQMGSIGKAISVIRSPAAKAMLRAKQAMTKVDPVKQAGVVKKLSKIVEEPLRLRTGETIFPKEVLQRFKRSIK